MEEIGQAHENTHIYTHGPGFFLLNMEARPLTKPQRKKREMDLVKYLEFPPSRVPKKKMKLAPFTGPGALSKARNGKYSWLSFGPYGVLLFTPAPTTTPHHRLTLPTVFELGIVHMFI